MHKHTFLPSPSCTSEDKYTVFEAGTEFQVGNPGRELTIPSQTEKSSYLVNAFTGYALEDKVIWCRANTDNFYYIKAKINIYITTVPEPISWDAALCFQWGPEMIAKE